MYQKPLFGGKKIKQKNTSSIIPEGMKGGVFYIRVSTGKQEEKGNGLEAQKEAILNFARSNDVFQIGEFYTEIGSGGATIDKRPILQEAIEMAKMHDAYLITSKLDRLSRKAAMVTNMLEDKFKFVTVEHGFQTEDLFIRILAALAQKERELIGERTSAALKQLKKKYDEEYRKEVESGNKNAKKKRLGIPSVEDAPSHISHQRREEGLSRSKKYINEMINPVIEELKKEIGKNPSRKLISDRMNQKGFKTEYGSEWSESIIYHTIRKIKAEEKRQERLLKRKENKSLERSPNKVSKEIEITEEHNSDSEIETYNKDSDEEIYEEEIIVEIN